MRETQSPYLCLQWLKKYLIYNTHAVLKYKDHGTMFIGKADDKRQVVTHEFRKYLNNKIKDLKPSGIRRFWYGEWT